LIVEAIKQVYAEVRVVVKKPAFVPIPALPGLSPVGRKVVQETRAIEPDNPSRPCQETA
jgi:hypothetical protein